MEVSMRNGHAIDTGSDNDIALYANKAAYFVGTQVVCEDCLGDADIEGYVTDEDLAQGAIFCTRCACVIRLESLG